MKLKRYSANKLHWFAYKSDFNRGIIESWDVFNNSRLKEDIVNEFKKASTFEEFQDKLESEIMYNYWSKCEYEIILGFWPPRNDGKEEKIDVYDQIMLNFDQFSEYVWNTLLNGPTEHKHYVKKR